MTRALDTSTAVDEFVGTHPVAAVYFSSPDCQVCHVLKPKLWIARPTRNRRHSSRSLPCLPW